MDDISFDLVFNSKLIKNKIFEKDISVSLNEDGIKSGNPQFSFLSSSDDEKAYSGIIFGRPYNKLLKLNIKSQDNAILRKDDIINLSFLDTNIKWIENQKEYIVFNGNDAKNKVEIFKSEGSGLTSGLAWATGFVQLPDEEIKINIGDKVKYIPFSSFDL